MHQRMFLDIETIPAGDDKRDTLKFLHEKRVQKKAKEGKEESSVEDFEQYLLRTNFDGAFGRILCIGYAIDRNPAEVLYFNGDEKKMLTEFWRLAKDCYLYVGHNVIDFDMRFIYQRSVIHQVVPSVDLNFARYRSQPMFDTMKEWARWANSNIGLEQLALALGIPSPKDGIDGSQVWDFYQAGKIDDILAYCKRDVETTREVYKRLIFSA